MTDDAQGGVVGRRRRRRRPVDSIGHYSRYAAPIFVVAAVATTVPHLSVALPCGDSPLYLSPVGLTCSQHASLEIGCEEFGSVGLREDEVNDLQQNCPRACGIPGNRDDCDYGNEEAGGEHANSARILQSDPAGTCYGGCQDDPSYRTKYLLSCENHRRLNCESFAEVGFSEWEIFDLVVSCPCACNIPCGTYTQSPSASPSLAPTDDFYRCDHPRCQDDPTYRSKLSLSCDSHARFDCANMGAIGYSEEEVSELISRCPCSCRTICPDIFISEAPTPRPSIGASPMPSFLPSMAFSSSPSSPPSEAASSLPSMQPSVGVSSSPSSRPSVARPVGTISSPPITDVAMKSSSDVVATISALVAQWGKKSTNLPTKPPVTLDPTPNPSMSPVARPSTVKPSASPISKSPTAKPSPSPISKSPTAMPITERPSGLPTIAPTKGKEQYPEHESPGANSQTHQADEHAEVNILGRIEEFPLAPNNSGVGSGPKTTGGTSKAVPVLAVLFSLTIFGGALFIFTKKYPEQLSTVSSKLRGAMERMQMILRVARGDDLAEIVSKANVEDRNFDLARNDSFGSAKSSVSFAKELVTVFEIPSSIPVRRSVSFADNFGEELATELGPGPADSFDEEVVVELGPERAATRSMGKNITTEPEPEPCVHLGEEISAKLKPVPVESLSKKSTTKLQPVPVKGRDKRGTRELGPMPVKGRDKRGTTKLEAAPVKGRDQKGSTKQEPGPTTATTRGTGEKVTPNLGLEQTISLDEIDDYLDSSSRSSAEGDIDTDSSGSLSMGTYDSADNSMVSDPGPLTLRAYLGKREISIPLPGIVSLSSMGVQSNSYDESV